MASLTSHLLDLDPISLQEATTHPFLTAAATGTLQTEKLQHWLAQDRLYALSYANFIGQLITLVPIPTHPGREESVEWKVVEALIDCLVNIRREVKMFEDVARSEGWMGVLGKGVKVEQPSRSYQDLFAGSTAMGRGLVVGMTVLWATEECYLRAWRYASEKRTEGDDVMRKTFIPNWSSEEFAEFVARMKGLVDELAKDWQVEEGGWLWKECENAWRQVVWAETEFWPNFE